MNSIIVLMDGVDEKHRDAVLKITQSLPGLFQCNVYVDFYDAAPKHIEWTGYDGRPETLPVPLRCVMVYEDGRGTYTPVLADHSDMVWRGFNDKTFQRDICIGDTWAYWPEAPETV